MTLEKLIALLQYLHKENPNYAIQIGMGKVDPIPLHTVYVDVETDTIKLISEREHNILQR